MSHGLTRRPPLRPRHFALWLGVLAITLPAIVARAAPAAPAPTATPQAASFTVRAAMVADEKAVFATVESRNVVPARARIGGTVADLAVHDGDQVTQGQLLAVVADRKLLLQVQALDAQIAGLHSQMAQAQIDLNRARSLSGSGAVSRSQLDQARTAMQVASSALASRVAERSVTEQQIAEGRVLAPVAGRVLVVPVTNGSVLQPGETLAMIAEQHFVLRLKIPERHAMFLKVGDIVRMDGKELGESGPTFGKITLVYPQITQGEVRADATAPGIGTYFVGERIRVWVSAGARRTIVIPASFVLTRFGLDYVRTRTADGTLIDIPIQRGRSMPTPQMPDGLEILSGLSAGQVLVKP